MRNQLLLILFLFLTHGNFAQSFRLHAEYRNDWYGPGAVMNEDIPGYPAVTLQAQTTADQFVIETNNSANRWRKYGYTNLNEWAPYVMYTLIVTDNYLSDSTTIGKWYTTRLKNVGVQSTNAIVMETTNAPVDFTANPISQNPANVVSYGQPVTISVSLLQPKSIEEFVYVRYSTDNFQSSQIIPVAILPQGDSGVAVIPGLPPATEVTYYAFTSTVNIGSNFLDYDLITLKQANNGGVNYQYRTSAFMVDVTFLLDLTGQTISPDGVHLAGSFNNFDPDSLPMDSVGSGLYAATISLDSSATVKYKFINGNEFITGEEEQVPALCGVPNGFGGYDRELIVPNLSDTLPIVCFSSCSACVPANPVIVTFQVDLGGSLPSIDGVHLTGSFNGFDPDSLFMSNIGGSIYSVDVTLNSGSQIEYKFINGNEFIPGEEETVPSGCGVPNGFGGYNRSLTIPLSGVTLPPVCISSCGPCSVAGFADVVFSVDLSQQLVSADGVHLAGSFNGFNPTSLPMSTTGNSIYRTTVRLDTSLTVLYKFINGNELIFGEEEIVPQQCGVPNGFGGFNRTLQVSNVDDSLDLVCFSSCAACVPLSFDTVVLLLNLGLLPPNTDGVHVAGSFNNFDPDSTLMTLVNGAVYAATIIVPSGSSFQYKFINGNEFITGEEETVPQSCGVPNGFGGYNRNFTTTLSRDTIGPVCFSACSNCNPTSTVTIRMQLGALPVNADGVHLAGNFNGFSPDSTLMNVVLGNTFEYQAQFEEGSVVLYKFINGNEFILGEEESVPQACGVPNGFGGFNRSFTVPAQDTILEAVCFSSCGPCPTSLNNYIEALASYYPNPMDDYIRIELKKEVSSIIVTDALGARVAELTNVRGVIQLDTELWSSGLYIVQLISNQQVQVIKLLRQ
jgi:hypothetical protein